jgi:hypothetical protein
MKGAAMFTAILLALAALLGPAAAPSAAKPARAVAAPGEARLFLFPASGGADALTMTLI